MAIKKSELYTSLWKSCDEPRGGMDASQYKDYVLVLLFVKYVSGKAASQKNYLLDVPKGGSFSDMVALKGDKEIGDKMNKIVAKLAEKNQLKRVIDVADWNDSDTHGRSPTIASDFLGAGIATGYASWHRAFSRSGRTSSGSTSAREASNA
jgi:type I restriction enzyme M protein